MFFITSACPYPSALSPFMRTIKVGLPTLWFYKRRLWLRVEGLVPGTNAHWAPVASGGLPPSGRGDFSGAAVPPAPGFSAIFRGVFSPSGGGVLFGRCTFTVRPYESVPDFRPWCLAGLAIDGLNLKVPQNSKTPVTISLAATPHSFSKLASQRPQALSSSSTCKLLFWCPPSPPLPFGTNEAWLFLVCVGWVGRFIRR